MRTQIVQLTSIRAAFERIQVKASAYKGTGGAIIAGLIHDKLATNAGVSKIPSWNSSLSFKTATALDAPNFDPKVTVRKGTPEQKTISIFDTVKWSTGTYNKMCA